MANLAASAVTLISAWSEGDVHGKRRKGLLVQIVLGAQGSATNKVLASALGLSKVESCGNAVNTDNTYIIVAVPAYDGTFILLNAIVADGQPLAPTDITGTTIRLEVRGY